MTANQLKIGTKVFRKLRLSVSLSVTSGQVLPQSYCVFFNRTIFTCLHFILFYLFIRSEAFTFSMATPRDRSKFLPRLATHWPLVASYYNDIKQLFFRPRVLSTMVYTAQRLEPITAP